MGIERTNKYRICDLLINSICVLIIIAGFITVGRVFLLNRSLWVDEAMLVWSIKNENLFQLFSGALAWDQSAPWGYLLLIKLITMIAGTSEYVLRSFSIIAYLITLVMMYIIGKNVLKVRYPLICVTFIAINQIFIQYTNEFKPYMFDCFVVLCVIYSYYMYMVGKISIKGLTGISVIAILSSNPALFFVASIFIFEFLSNLINKRWEATAKYLLCGLLVLFIFGVYYLIWLRLVTTNEYMINYWMEKKFPINLFSAKNLQKAKELLSELLNVFGNNKKWVLILTVFSCVVGIIKKNKIIIVTIIAILLAAIASSMGFFPVAVRLWLFLYPVIALLAFYSLLGLFEKNESKYAMYVCALIGGVLVTQNTGFSHYKDITAAYYRGEEIRELVSYVKDNVTEDEKVYVTYWGIPAFCYENGYERNGIGPFDNNIIWGTYNYSGDDDFNIISEQDSCYLICSHFDNTDNLIVKNLKEHGYVEQILNQYDTPLLYFTKNINNLRAKTSYELVSISNDSERCKLVVRIKNEGASYLNPTCCPVGFRSKENPDIVIHIPQNIKPGEVVETVCEFEWKGREELELQLAGEQFWFDEIGVDPIVIKRSDSRMGADEVLKVAESYAKEGYTIVIAGRDDFSANWNDNLQKSMELLGLEENLFGKIQYSYIAVIEDGHRQYEELECQKLDFCFESGNGTSINIMSAGLYNGNSASIKISDVEYCVNGRGINIVIFNNYSNELVMSACIDTNLDYRTTFFK